MAFLLLRLFSLPIREWVALDTLEMQTNTNADAHSHVANRISNTPVYIAVWNI